MSLLQITADATNMICYIFVELIRLWQ